MFVWQIITFFLLLISAFICAYYWFLALAALFVKEKTAFPSNHFVGQSVPFAIIIPAHDEEAVIAKTLQSCLDLDYPRDRYDIFVVADNCSDKTADVARSYGVEVLERHNTAQRGKGYALSFAFEHILANDYEAVAVIDADCLIDKDALQVIAQSLLLGSKVIQIDNRVSNPDDTVMTYALAVGNTIENDFFYAPKSRMGLAVFLRGTGMVFHRDVLLAHPWDAHSIVEDMEYTLTLLRAGYTIQFLPQVKVQSPSPVDREQFRVQRTRWASGNLSFGRKAALGLIWEGVNGRKWTLVDAGWTFLVLSKPLVLLLLVMNLAVVLFVNAMDPTPFMQINLVCLLAVLLLMIAYFFAGIVRLGLSAKRLVLLARVPLTILSLMIISLLGVIGVKKDSWARTPR